MSRYLSLFVLAALVTIAAEARAQQAAVPVMPPTTPAQTPPPARPGQQQGQQGQGRPGPQGQSPQPAQPTTTPPVAPVYQSPPYQTRPDSVPMQNIRVDLQITDASGSTNPAKKVVTMLIADGRNGRIRSANSVAALVQKDAPGESYTTRSILINVDASAAVRTDGRILLNLTIEYSPDAATSANKPAGISESLTVLVNDGKLTLVSQSADPNTDRQVKVEVMATIVK